MFGLYLHIPYCLSKCRYCDFYSLAHRNAVPDAYVDALCREMALFDARGQLARPDTVYFGGGTPSLLSPEQTARLLAAAHPVPGAEITLEANPETVTFERAHGWHSAGVNRLSIGVQTARDESLARLGRRHTAADSRRALRIARQAGFDNISGDVMLALPSYSSAELYETLDLLCEGGCTHVSSYLLAVEPGTAFGKHPPAGLPDDDAAAAFYLDAVECLRALGYRQYEISNFCLPGRESRHNLLYWNCEEYLGLGPTAHSCLGGRRFSTPRGVDAFCAGPAVYASEGTCDASDYIMLRLRLRDGLFLPELERRWGTTFTPAQHALAARLAREGFARFDGKTLALTPRGMLIQNSILCELL